MATTESSNREALQVLNSINIFTDKENFVAGKNVHRSKQQQPPSSLIGSNPGGAKQRSDSSNIILRSNCESAIIPASFNSNTIAIYQDDDDDVSGSENHQMIPVAVQQNPLLDETSCSRKLPLQEISVKSTQQHHSICDQLGSFRDRFEVSDYQRDILDYLKEAERKCRPKYDYMRKQPDINSNMRTVLVDWVVEVCEEYRLNTETLYLAVSYVDRFLSYMSVVRSKLQLVGTSAMFIAAKFEEIYPPDVSDFVYITDDTYTKKQVLRMEQLILKVLSFDMSSPTTYAFINLFSTIESLSDNIKFLAMYLCELSLMYASPFLQYLPSRVAAAAIAYARLLLNHDGMWTRSLELMTGYELSHLQQVIGELNQVHGKCQGLSQKAVQEKYKASKYNEIALVDPVELTDEMFELTNEKISKELEEAVKIMKM